MGFFNKIVNLLSDPVEDEEEVIETKAPIKEEKAVVRATKKEETPEVKKEVKKTNHEEKKEKELTKKEPERGLYQSKDTFKFPVFNDDEIDETLSRSRVSDNNRVLERRSEAPKVVPSFEKPSVIASKLEKKEPAPVVEEKKVFRPSPVISPVYGVLDKNYTKEDIVDKNEEIKSSQTRVDISNTSAISYDVVRRKAYGTLEDELEDTLSGRFKKKEESVDAKVNEVKNDIKDLENPKKHIEKLLDELEKTASMTVGEIEEALKDNLDDTNKYDLPDTLINGLNTQSISNVEEELEATEEFKPKDFKDTPKNDEELENDLFNLIDSMYQESEE